MQPHSMSALAVANHTFSFHYGLKVPKSAEVEIRYQNAERETKVLFHSITSIKPIEVGGEGRKYLAGLDIDVKTTDGSTCTLTVKRRSTGEFKQGEEVDVTHSVQHIAGLTEIYSLSRSGIRGYHRGSRKYRNFKSNRIDEGYFGFECEVFVPETKKFITVPYYVKIKPSFK